MSSGPGRASPPPGKVRGWGRPCNKGLSLGISSKCSTQGKGARKAQGGNSEAEQVTD